MSQDELIAETNRLLRTILEHDAEQRSKFDKTMADHDAKMAEVDAKRREEMKTRLREEGLPEEAISGTDEDWEALRKAKQKASQERLEKATQREQRYKEELLAELAAQTGLLRQIAERLNS